MFAGRQLQWRLTAQSQLKVESAIEGYYQLQCYVNSEVLRTRFGRKRFLVLSPYFENVTEQN
jgi:hypothetical protein